MKIKNETTFGDELTEHEVDYKVNGGTPPLPDVLPAEPGGPCDIFDDQWRMIPPNGVVGPCLPPEGQRPPWTVRFGLRSGDLIEEIGVGYASAASTVILRGTTGAFEVEVLTPGPV